MNEMNLTLKGPMKKQHKAALISATVVTVQIGFAISTCFFFDVISLGRVLVGTLFVGAFLFYGHEAVKLLSCSSGPVFSIHPASIWMPFLLVGIFVLGGYTAGPDASYATEFLGITAAFSLSAFATACNAFDLVEGDRLLGAEWPVPPRTALLAILIGPQVVIALTATAAVALKYGI